MLMIQFRQLRRTFDGHRHDRRAVAAPSETLAAMNRARTHIDLGLFTVNLQLDFGLGSINNSESAFGCVMPDRIRAE